MNNRRFMKAEFSYVDSLLINNRRFMETESHWHLRRSADRRRGYPTVWEPDFFKLLDFLFFNSNNKKYLEKNRFFIPFYEKEVAKHKVTIKPE